MSAKLLHSLTDDNRDLQKQIGCMNGIFQLFDRHHFLTGKRITGHIHKRLPPGHSHLSNGNLGGGSHNEIYSQSQTTTENKLNRNANENQRDSIESSRASFSSSSCSSSFSSVDCNKVTKPEPHSPRLGRQSLDFRDMVKDSIYREARVSSVKTTAKEEPVSHALKHRDSPRPLHLPKSFDESFEVGVNGKHRVPIDHKGSLGVLSKFQEAPQHFNNTREPQRSSYEVRDGASFSAPKDSPRFSYDGQESQDRFKSTSKLRELPRLSLDSRESSMKVSDASPKSNSTLKDFQRSPKSNLNLKDFQSGSRNYNKPSSPHKESESHKKHPSVVAKLMGLDAMPSSILARDGQTGLIKTYQGEDHNSFSRPSKITTECKENGISNSPRRSLKEPALPQLRNPNVVMKQISSSRFPIEPAPWRHPAFRNRENPPRVPNASPSVYAEIEKRLKELEFKQSDKDLRALKQILDAIQMKGLLETKNEQGPALISETNCDKQNWTSLDQNLRLGYKPNPVTKHPISDTKVTSHLRTFESPIVIMKPAKLIEKSGIPASSVVPIYGLPGLHKLRSGNSIDSKKVSVNSRTVKDLTPKLSVRGTANQTLSSTEKRANGRTLKPSQTSSQSQLFPRENTRNSGRSSVSPRLHQKKLELGRQSRSPTPSSDLSRPRRQSVKQPIESGSPSGKCRPRCPNVQQGNDQFTEISSETRILSHQGDEISLSDSNTSLVSHIDVEVTSADRSTEIKCNFFQQGSQSPCEKVSKDMDPSFKQEKPSARLSEDVSVAEPPAIAPEQPSPVSVLDASFYRDDLPSSRKKISEPFKDTDGGSQNSDDSPCEDEWNPVDDSPGSNFSSDINRKKLENIEHLVQKLRRLNSNHNEATTDYIASLCENTNPDNRYISEILLASGLLLRDLGSGLATIQLHPSGHPINPDLFFVLEQTKSVTGLSKDECYREKVVDLKSDQDRIHRKLVFDAINEILGQKLALVGPSPIRVDRLAWKTLNAQQLLKEICSEIEQLQANENFDCIFNDDDDGLKAILFNDVMHGSENWTDFQRELSGVVLDVERLIFKDLVDEIVNGIAANVHLGTKPSRRCRQLFAK